MYILSSYLCKEAKNDAKEFGICESYIETKLFEEFLLYLLNIKFELTKGIFNARKYMLLESYATYISSGMFILGEYFSIFQKSGAYSRSF